MTKVNLPPGEITKVWVDEQAKLAPVAPPRLSTLALCVHDACIEIGRQWRIAGAQQ